MKQLAAGFGVAVYSRTHRGRIHYYMKENGYKTAITVSHARTLIQEIGPGTPTQQQLKLLRSKN